MDDLNYLIWRLQVVTVVNGYDLYTFLLGGKHIPTHFLTGEDELLNRPNPQYLSWKRQDKVLMSWMVMSMTEGMVSRMVQCSHSYEVWSTVDTYFASQTQARQRQLFTQLRSTKKGSLGMSDYLLQLKKVADALASINQLILERDYIETILHARLEAAKNDSSDAISANFVQTQSRNFSQNNRMQSNMSPNTFNNRGGSSNRDTHVPLSKIDGDVSATTFPSQETSSHDSDNSSPTLPTPDTSLPLPTSQHIGQQQVNTTPTVTPNPTPILPNDQIPLPTTSTNLHPMVTRAKAGIFKPKALLASTEPTSVHCGSVTVCYLDTA
ncbi:Retrovirus-related Pol polyprotein from transposon TNT 1-94 [Senna tora]|uniref:Retrovirus-related Pol polyprotein from transposon TNT 1-94 n=1 Tax=Senna tora TaxID=362788 RepID=A0A834WVW1_9FABA|nr:Retrovirus-related Pol polyprotein from transposon TNT 1-94 [Senna tora]